MSVSDHERFSTMSENFLKNLESL